MAYSILKEKRVITWNDLQTICDEEIIEHAYSQWPNLRSQIIKPVFIDAFGNMFFENKENDVYLLDLLELKSNKIGIKCNEFAAYINRKETIENQLMSMMVENLIEKGMIRNRNEVYGFAPHPAWTGKLDIKNVMIMDIVVWVSICSQIEI